jgi:hypothetical protein
MADAETGSSGRPRIPPWAVAAVVLLLIPALAMQVSEEWDWDLADFAIIGALMFGSGITYELVVRKMSSMAYRVAVAIALVAALLLVWVNGAVGIIGSEDHDANLMYGGVIAVGLLGAVIARCRPVGMARTLFATAIAQTLVAVIALFARWGSPRDIVMLTGFFVLLWVASASLFAAAARAEGEQRTA